MRFYDVETRYGNGILTSVQKVKQMYALSVSMLDAYGNHGVTSAIVLCAMASMHFSRSKITGQN